MNLWKWLEKRLETKNDPLRGKFDAVVAVGIDVEKNGEGPSLYSQAVVHKSCVLCVDFHPKHLILSGGYKIKSSFTEARTMMNSLIVKPGCMCILEDVDIILEEESYRTYMNADNSIKILKKLGCKKVIVVAQQMHAQRVRATFKKRGKDSGIEFFVVKAHSDYGGGSQKRLDHFWSFLLWDTLAFIFSKLKGYC